MPNETPIVFALAPDKQTAAVFRRALERAGMSRCEIAHNSGAIEKLMPRLADAASAATLAVLTPSFPRPAAEAVSIASSLGGLAVCALDLMRDGAAGGDGWALGQLLSQRGCLPCPDLESAAEAIRLHAFCGGECSPRIRRQPRRSAVARNLEVAAERYGLLCASGEDGAALALEIADSGAVSLRRRNARLELERPESSLAALALLASRTPSAGRPAQRPRFDREVVDLIVRPPRRLLSETASKRLLAAFGIALPQERLSTSPTESARFAAELGSPAVLKLVRPETADKSALDAVRTGIVGAAMSRRAHHHLARVGASLGPPAPLGVLVAQEITGGARIWLVGSRHTELGALVVGGRGDRPTAAPEFALAAPASEAEAESALGRAELADTAGQRAALAAAVARFSCLVSELGGRIDRAEIHPLVALDDGPAVALDALVGVAG
jgi:hypothetical protein